MTLIFFHCSVKNETELLKDKTISQREHFNDTNIKLRFIPACCYTVTILRSGLTFQFVTEMLTPRCHLHEK